MAETVFEEVTSLPAGRYMRVTETTDVVSTEYTIHAHGSFVWALSWLKDGKAKMRRKSWLPGLYIYRQKLGMTMVDSGDTNNFASRPWHASNGDLFAEDWEVYDEG